MMEMKRMWNDEHPFSLLSIPTLLKTPFKEKKIVIYRFTTKPGLVKLLTEQVFLVQGLCRKSQMSSIGKPDWQNKFYYSTPLEQFP